MGTRRTAHLIVYLLHGCTCTRAGPRGGMLTRSPNGASMVDHATHLISAYLVEGRVPLIDCQHAPTRYFFFDLLSPSGAPSQVACRSTSCSLNWPTATSSLELLPLTQPVFTQLLFICDRRRGTCSPPSRLPAPWLRRMCSAVIAYGCLVLHMPAAGAVPMLRIYFRGSEQASPLTGSTAVVVADHSGRAECATPACCMPA
jgi:hypothetical protein